ncbi:MAG: AAA family ATPase [Patescibacteria group bacterium]
MTQSHALTILKTGRSIFLTGPAGSGKTYVLNQYIKYLKDHDVNVGITASTGIAATHMGGMTIHSWAGLGIKDYMSDEDLAELAEKPQLVKRFKETQVLIIDEVSMLHHFRLDILDKVARHMRSVRKLFDTPTDEDMSSLKDKPFGGMQVILCGDFFQLPPVSRMGEPEAHFIYRSQAWKDANFTVCYLEENYRQGGDPLVNILNEIRSGEVSEEAREQLKERYQAEAISEIEPTQLFTHNTHVDALNDTELTKVEETEFRYEMTSRGKKPLVDVLKKSCLAPEILRLKKGARVMCVKNNFEKGYVNGTLGIVVSCGPNVDPVIRTAQDKLVTIERTSWEIDDGGRVLAEISQHPLRLAWAITVHKSQGMSLDAVTVDLSRCFEPGMGYVALSRVRTLTGLVINGFNENALRVHPEVLEYDRHLRELSGKAESVVEHTDEKEIIRAHEEFLARVAPLYSIGKEGKRKKGQGERGKSQKGQGTKVSTFDQTLPLLRAEKSLNEMARERKLASETIISHVEHLIGTGALSLGEVMYLKKEISPGHFVKIEKALEEVSDNQGDDNLPLLSPVKSKVGFNVSFKEIRLARVLLGYVRYGEEENIKK